MWSFLFSFDKLAAGRRRVFFFLSTSHLFLLSLFHLSTPLAKTGNDRPQHLPPPVSRRLRRVQDHGRGKQEKKIGFDSVWFSFCSLISTSKPHNKNLTLSKKKKNSLQTALRVVAALLSMEILDDKKEITMYINSAGGSPYSAVGIVDTMRTLRPKIRTVAFGQAATTASLLLAAGAKGQRYAMPSARIMLHQPIGGAAGSADEVNITATELHRTSRLINCFLAEFTGKTEEEVEVESDRPSWMSPAQALDFGIIDHVLPPNGGGVVLDSRAMAAAAAAAAAVEFEQMKLAKEDGSKEGDIEV